MAVAAAAGQPFSVPLGQAPDFLYFTGKLPNTLVQDIKQECMRLEPILVETALIDHEYTSGKVYVFKRSYRTTRADPSGWSEYQMVLQVLGQASDYRPCTEIRRTLFPNSFAKYGTIVLPLPAGVCTGLRNGDFERNFKHWTQNSSTIETTIVHGGLQSSKLVAAGSPISGCQSEFIAVDLTRQHTFSGYYNVTAVSAGNFKIVVTMYDEGASVISTDTAVNATAATSGWTSFSKTYGPSGNVEFPPSTTWVKVDTRWDTSPTGTAYVDDLNFKLTSGVDSCGEYVSYYRRAYDCYIPCVASPTQPVVDYGVAEADLAKGNLSVSRNTYGEMVMSNQLIRLTTRQKHDYPGRVLLEACVDGAWSGIGTVGFAVKSSTKDLEYGDNVTAYPEVGFAEKVKDRETIRLTYPSTSTDKRYKFLVHATLMRGIPFASFELLDWGGALVEARCNIAPAGTFGIGNTDFRYYNRHGEVLDAQAGVYGTDEVEGDSDSLNFFLLQDTPTIGLGSLEVGFITHKQVDRNYIGVDAGDYWEKIVLVWDNLTLDRSLPAPLFTIFAQKQSNTFSAPAELGDQACINLFPLQWVTEVT